ncbi:MAG: hypothetical protein M3M99_03630, partial [Actinomycetota bacterium]|nr:hypothetical protein [Actinomycetota bacterium]
QHGRGRPLLEIVASVRYLALIAVDVLIAIGTALGLVLLIVPGILFATYTYVAPVLIELQDVSIRRSFSKSLELVRGHFWPVLAIGLLFYAGTEAAVNALMLPFHGFAHEVGAHLAIESVFEPLQGIATVLVGLRLLELHGETPSSSLVRPLSPAAEPE